MKDMPSAAKQAACKSNGGGDTTARLEGKRSRAVTQKKGSSRPHQYLGDGAHRLFVFGNDADVEDGGEDEDEARSRGGTWVETTVNSH